MKTGFRAIKKQLSEILSKDDFSSRLSRLYGSCSSRLLTKALISFIYGSGIEKWRAVSSLGTVTDMIFQEDPEEARNIMRQLIWNLNEESGCIPWGSPEAMGEIMACNRELAKEFASILISLIIEEEDNYLQWEELRKGVVWGIGRLAQSEPQLVKYVVPILKQYAKLDDPDFRGRSIWALSLIDKGILDELPGPVRNDEREIQIYCDGDLFEIKIRMIFRVPYS